MLIRFGEKHGIRVAYSGGVVAITRNTLESTTTF